MLENSLKKGEGLQKLTDTVYAFIGHEGDSNHGFLMTEKGVVVIDNDIRDVNEFMEAIQKTTKKEIKLLINTHHAFDHASANQIFAERGAVIISSTKCREWLAKFGENKFEEMRARDEKTRELTQGIKVVLPDITFDSHLSIHLGSHLLELIYVRHCHSPGDIIVYIPKEKIVFVGDLLLNKCHPNIKEGNLSNWLRTLDQIYEMPIDIVIPGHGLIIKGKDDFRALKKYFIRVKTRVEEMMNLGKKLEDIQKELTLPEYQDWGKTRWLPYTIDKIYQELAS